MRKIAIFLNLMALLVAAWMTDQLRTMHLYTGIETTTNGKGATTVASTQTLAEVNGRWVINNLVGLAAASGVPLLVSGILSPLIHRKLTNNQNNKH